MRHLTSFFKKLFNDPLSIFRRDRDKDESDSQYRHSRSSAGTDETGSIYPAQSPEPMTKRGSPRWWGGVAAWGIHGNEEFTKWWNHWMERIPHSGNGLTANQTKEPYIIRDRHGS
jgi:hypothetical protein